MSDKSIEQIRLSYKPERIKVLLVGESAPDAGTFFYKADTLCGYTQKAFARVFDDAVGISGYDFLDYFEAKGCYLDDLCLMPVDAMGKTERKSCWQAGVPQLAKRLAEYKPDVVIAILLSIKDYVREACDRAKLDNAIRFAIPFAGNGNQGRYVDELAKILRELRVKQIV
ncbi:MAG: hypothetical protein P4N59_03955 [Negativicutes bacterium]|nr:hypothetical protein [Negativicutes bacterium]